MPQRFEVLAQYNTEVHRGVAHTPEWDSQMRYLQADFNDWLAKTTAKGK